MENLWCFGRFRSQFETENNIDSADKWSPLHTLSVSFLWITSDLAEALALWVTSWGLSTRIIQRVCQTLTAYVHAQSS